MSRLSFWIHLHKKFIYTISLFLNHTLSGYQAMLCKAFRCNRRHRFQKAILWLILQWNWTTCKRRWYMVSLAAVWQSSAAGKVHLCKYLFFVKNILLLVFLSVYLQNLFCAVSICKEKAFEKFGIKSFSPIFSFVHLVTLSYALADKAMFYFVSA